jgi:hypothetical protein
MKRLTVGVTLPLLMGTWFLVQHGDIVSKSISTVTRAYDAINEAVDRLPTKAATLKLWLPFIPSSMESTLPEQSPVSSCTLRDGLGSPSDDLVSYLHSGDLRVSLAISPRRPRFSPGTGRKQPAGLSKGFLFAANSGELDQDSSLHQGSWIFSPSGANNLWRGFIPGIRRPVCPGSRDL